MAKKKAKAVKHKKVKEVKATKDKEMKAKKIHEVNWVLAVIMSVLFGQLGVDRFMMGQVGWGILKLITFGGIGLWWLVDVILIATKYEFKNVKWV